MSAPDLPRFKVSSVTGYPGGQTGAGLSTGYSVLDTWDTHKEVASFYVPNHGGKEALREARARDRCAELEAWHEQAMADGA